VAYQASGLLTPGQMVVAQGWLLSTAYGRVLEAQSLPAAPGQPGGPPPAHP
jgi:hypothetical protein